MARGAKPGERRGGRKAGTPNKLTVTLKATLVETAQQYTAEALQTMLNIMADAKASAAARVACANSILDRGHGKAPQRLEHTGEDGGPIEYRDAARERLAHLIAGEAARLADEDSAAVDAAASGKPSV
jgi:hypothetical protein